MVSVGKQEPLHEEGCINYPRYSIKNILEDDSTGEISIQKDRHEEDGLNPPKLWMIDL